MNFCNLEGRALELYLKKSKRNNGKICVTIQQVLLLWIARFPLCPNHIHAAANSFVNDYQSSSQENYFYAKQEKVNQNVPLLHRIAVICNIPTEK
jgi:hypothetical protein